MSMRRFAAIFVVALAGAAVLASSASAAPATEGKKWWQGAVLAELVGPEGLSAKIAEHPVIGKKFLLATEVAAVEVELEATTLTCVGCVHENKAITGQPAVTAFWNGKLKFTNVTVLKPAGCNVKSEVNNPKEILTKQLKIHADWMENGKALQEVMPENGAVLAKFALEGGGCAPFAGFRNLTGNLWGETTAGTNAFAANQNVAFTPAIQAAAGGAMAYGPESAEATGTLALSQANGEQFGIK